MEFACSDSKGFNFKYPLIILNVSVPFCIVFSFLRKTSH